MQPAKLDLNIVQGATLRDSIRIMQPRYEYKPITAITSTAPVQLTVEHGLPGNWLVWVDGAQKVRPNPFHRSAKCRLRR